MYTSALKSALFEKYRALLLDFPPITVQKVGEAQLETPEGKAKAIGQLIGKHGGELVEVNRLHTKWTLERVAPGSASAKVSEQWYCQPEGAKAGKPILNVAGTETSATSRFSLTMRSKMPKGAAAKFQRMP